MLLNISNVEEKVLFDSTLVKLLKLDYLVNKWKFGKKQNMPSVAQEAALEFLNSLTDEHIEILKNYFKNEIVLEKLNKDLTFDDIICIEDLMDYLNKKDLGGWNISLYRDEKTVKITGWR